MNQASSFNSINIIHLTLQNLRQKMSARGMTSNARLLRLSSQLNQWNTERVFTKQADGQPQDLSIEDVDFLKDTIHAEVSKASVKQPEVVSDQMLFLVIGAIQIQSQTGSDEAWRLVNRSMQSFVIPDNEKRTLLFGLVAATLVIYISTMTALNSKMHSIDNAPLNPPIITTDGMTDPVTISTLLLVYNKMKSGTCQIPQAAMLQPEQRQAFLRFINKGLIEVHDVENLKLALGYVNCLYPQELMHPILPEENGIAKIAL
jgi:hypothetical protein